MPRSLIPRWLRASQPSSASSPASPPNASLDQQIQEQINLTAGASSPTQEDWYWGRLATGGEEDHYWQRLSDNWYQKDPIP